MKKVTKDSLITWGIVTGIIIFLWLVVMVQHAFPVTMLDKAKPYLPVVREVVHKYWTDVKNEHYICGQIEQESGWKKYAELKTSREYGFGLAQITITPRFNNFLEARKKIKELSAWNWDDRFNEKYQLTYLTLTDKSNFQQMLKLLNSVKDIWAGTLVSYNAGKGTVLQRRALCASSVGCDKTRWFGGLDSVRMNYEKRVLYGKEVGNMRNEYPHVIIFVRSPKYKNVI
jgi:hypothetical protein